MARKYFKSAEERAAQTKAYQAAYRAAHLEQRRARERERYHEQKATPDGKAHLAKVRRDWRARNVEKLAEYEATQRPNREARNKATRERIRVWAKANAERYRKNRRHQEWRKRLRRYGISEAQYEAMDTGYCHLCAKSRAEFRQRFHVDHDKVTGIVRGLLCLNCNTGIGHLRHDPALLLKAIAYLERTASS